MKLNKTIKTAAFILVLLLIPGYMNAQEQDFNRIELNEPFTAGGSNPSTGVFTAPESGILTVTTNSWSLVGSYLIFTDDAFENVLPCIDTRDGANGLIYKYEVEEGESYYLLYDDFLNSITFIFTMTGEELTLSLNYMNPLPGNAFDINLNPRGVNLEFSPSDITWGNISFSYENAETGQTVTEEVTGVTLNYGILNVDITPYYRAAQLVAAPESKCKITIENIKYGDIPLTETAVNGDLEINNATLTFYYVFGIQPELTDMVLPNPFYAYWKSGDSSGKAVFTFSQPIASVGMASLNFGHLVYGEIPSEPAPNDPNAPENVEPYYLNPIISNNTIIIDFTGTIRSHYGYDEVTLFLQGVIDKNGLMVLFDDSPVLTAYIPYLDEMAPNNPNSKVSEILPDENGVYRVYNLTGACVMTTSDYSEIMALPKGIYIINGRKMTVGK